MNKKALWIGIVVILVVIIGVWMTQRATVAPVSTDESNNDSAMMDDKTPVESGTTTTPVPTPTPTPTPKPTPTPGTVKEFTVNGSSFAFAPSQMTVKKGDKVRIIFKNTGGTHDFVIDEFQAATKKIGSGQQETIEFVADKAGSFEYYCSVGNHRAMGMKGTLVVTE